MKRRLILIATILTMLTAMIVGGGHTAHADSSAITYTLTCSSIFTTYADFPAEYISVALDSNHADFLVPGQQYFTAPFSASWPAVPVGTLLYIIIGDGTNSLFTTVPCTNPSAGSQNVTFCNLSADGRIDGKCGDRIAVYCNAHATPPNLDVWVIDTSSIGHELAKLPLSSLVPSLTENLGANGIIHAGSDASGNGWVTLSGGPYGGTGTGDWAKTFKCSAG